MSVEPERTLLAFDLDDTLLPETTYIQAVYETIARRFPTLPAPDTLDLKKPYPTMERWARDDKEIFDAMTHIYRTAEGVKPITTDRLALLRALLDLGFTLALITDGHTVRQRAKLRLLGIEDCFSEIWISEERGSEKLSGIPFEEIKQRHPRLSTFIYVGDNPAKDFAPAIAHGWQTIMLKATPQNIHPQSVGTPANLTISNLSDLLPLFAR